MILVNARTICLPIGSLSLIFKFRILTDWKVLKITLMTKYKMPIKLYDTF